MYAMVFDTETTDLNKRFCYDLGYLIFDTESGEVIAKKHFVIEQIWHNLELFQTAYYADKRPLYIPLMRSRKATMDKWGYVMQEMIRDIKRFNIADIYAYNASFDESVFAFNCDWFKTQNPLDTLAIHDIWGYASEVITNTAEYKQFCETNGKFTESGNYSGTAETVYQFITNNPLFVEAHMGLQDSEIEFAILKHCVTKLGANYGEDYKVVKIIDRPIGHPYKIIVNGSVIHEGEFIKKSIYKGNYKFTEQTQPVTEP